MKLFRVRLSVEIIELGPLKESDPNVKFDDDPAGAMKQVAAAMAEVMPQRRRDKDCVSMSETVQVAAGSFEELQSILRKFHATAQSIGDPFLIEENKT